MKVDTLVYRIIRNALHFYATDLHFIPRKNDYLIQARIGGVITNFQRLPIPMVERIISYLKFSSAIDISEHRRPQTGSMKLLVDNQEIQMRISTLPTYLQLESLSIRILQTSPQLNFSKTTIFHKSFSPFLATIQLSHGLTLITGPTGSGKSTTMHILAAHCAKVLKRRVITVEDPVEISQDDFIQVQVNEKSGVSYDEALKAILRHDPDVIMIGEIRDRLTAQLAIRAALTGHLVLATLHANHTIGAIARLLDFNISIVDLQQTLVMVSAQRLVHLYCPFCLGACHIYCDWFSHTKRSTIYEQLHSHDLKKVLNNYPTYNVNYPLLKDQLRKGIALGYITKDEYYKWVQEKTITY